MHITDMPGADPTAPPWTTALVKAELIEACRWAVATAGPVGPSSVRSGSFAMMMSGDERELAGWDRVAGDDGRRRKSWSPARVSWFEIQVITWQGRYLAKDEGPGRVLKIWLRCKTFRRPFGEACTERQWSRATADRKRDTALGIIAQGLIRDRIELPRPGAR